MKYISLIIILNKVSVMKNANTKYLYMHILCTYTCMYIRTYDDNSSELDIDRIYYSNLVLTPKLIVLKTRNFHPLSTIVLCGQNTI